MSTHAKLVIVGSGIVGCSAAYHLAQLGWDDILVVDKGRPFENDGSTSHAPGGVVAFSHSKLMTQFALYSSNLYKNLNPYKPDRNTYNAVGGLEVAISDGRWHDLHRLHNFVKALGADSHLLTPAETKEKLPFLNKEAIVGSLFAPQSAIVKGAHVSGALARDAIAAADGGVRFVGHTTVTDIELTHGRVSAVITDNEELPRITCEHVLLCTNIWGPILGHKLGVDMPLMAFEHQYVITHPLDKLAEFDPSNKDDEVVFPTMRELDSAMYYRKHWNRFGIGSYWHRPHAIRPQDIEGNAIHPFTPDDFNEPWQQAQRLFPMLEDAELDTAFNGMFAFSVDGYPIMGPTQIGGLWTAVASWITHAGGVGKSIAEWMTHGHTEWDMRQCDVRRFNRWQTADTYVRMVTKKNYREVYDIVHPSQSPSEPRHVRVSPFHARQTAMGAEFAPFADMELPVWYEENGRLLEKYDERIPHRSGWAARHWSRIQGAEHLATRENVALYDLSGLSVFEVSGPGALAYIDHLCSNRMDKPPGSVVYTTWLTPEGGVRRDLTVARLADDKFWLFVGEGTRPRDWAWVRDHAPRDGSVSPADVSDQYAAVGVWGPNARRVLQKVTSADLDNDAFPFYTMQMIDIGPIPVLAMRISYVGELGWEIHMPIDSALPVWDAIWEAGREFDMIAAGSGAMNTLRLEKGYRLWGGDVYTEYTPYQSGLSWTVKLKKDDFIGRKACKLARQEPAKKKLCALTFAPPSSPTMAGSVAAFGYEPIFNNDDCIGHVTTAGYGYSIGKWVAYAYLPAAQAKPGTELEMAYFDQRVPVKVAQEPLFDPRMERMKM